MSPLTRAAGPSVGVALGADRLWAAGTPAASAAASRDWWSRPLETMDAGAAEWPALVAALAELRRSRAGDGTGSLSISLLAPLAQVRMIELPPLSADDALRVVSKNAGRYFLGVAEPQVVGLAGGTTARPGETAVAAAAAPARVVEAVYRAATAAGWTVSLMAPAYEAWLAAAHALWPTSRGRASQILVLGESSSDIILTHDDALARLRQFRDAHTDAARIAEALAEHPERLNGAARQPIPAFGPSKARSLVGDRLRASGQTLAAPEARWAAVAESPEGAAATFASEAGALALMPDAAIAARRAQTQRAARLLAAVAVALFVLGGVLMLWGTSRNLSTVRAQRAEIAPQVRQVAQARDTVARLTRRVTALRAVADGAPRWSTVLGNLAQHLPDNAYLTTFRAQGDSITINGIAQEAAPTIEALQRTPGLTRVAQFGQIRRGAVLGGETAEQFAVRAWLPAPTKSAPAARPVAAAAGAARP